MDRERVYEIPGLSDLADLAYINLDKRNWKKPNSPAAATSRSETRGFYVSKVNFAITGTLKYNENIEYALRCTTIGFKQKYGQKSSRLADMVCDADPSSRRK